MKSFAEEFFQVSEYSKLLKEAHLQLRFKIELPGCNRWRNELLKFDILANINGVKLRDLLFRSHIRHPFEKCKQNPSFLKKTCLILIKLNFHNSDLLACKHD